MCALRSLTVLAMRSGASADEAPSPEAAELVLARGGELLCHRDRVDLWSFLSPTEAVLAGLDAATRAPGAGVAVGVAIGEVDGDGDDVKGEPIDDATSLAVAARPRWVLFSKGASLSVNHNEVSGEQAGFFEVRGRQGKIEAFRAFRGKAQKNEEKEAIEATPTTAVTPTTATRQDTTNIETTGAGIGFATLVMVAIISFAIGMWTSASVDHFSIAEDAKDKGQSHYAIEQALLAWKNDPGNPEISAFLSTATIEAANRFMKAGRADRAIAILKRTHETLSFNDKIEQKLFEAASSQIAKWILARREGFATREEERITAILPHRAVDLRTAISKAKLKLLEDDISPLIASGRTNWDKYKEFSDRLKLVEKEFSDWGIVRYLWARLSLVVPHPRLDDVGRLFKEALRMDTKLADNRTILADVRRICERCTYKPDKSLADVRLVLSEGLGDWVVAELVPWLEEPNSVVRTTAFRALKARDALPSERKKLLDYHLKNLNMMASATQKKTTVGKLELIEALDFAGTLTDHSQIIRAKGAIDNMPGAANDFEGVPARAKEVLDALRSKLNR